MIDAVIASNALLIGILTRTLASTSTPAAVPPGANLIEGECRRVDPAPVRS